MTEAQIWEHTVRLRERMERFNLAHSLPDYPPVSPRDIGAAVRALQDFLGVGGISFEETMYLADFGCVERFTYWH